MPLIPAIIHPDPYKHLEELAEVEDTDICLASAALALAAGAKQPMDYYIDHLNQLVSDVSEYHQKLIDNTNDQLDLQLEALQTVIFGQHQYQGNNEDYDDLNNANLCAVIDQRKGMPIALSIICIHTAKLLGWDVAGIAMPGHFICRLDLNGERLIFDPFDSAKKVEAPKLRQLIKQALGPDAELKPAYYEPISNRMILLRLQNNIKTRQIAVGDHTSAIDTLEGMRKIAPDETSLLFELGQLYARTDQIQLAIEVLTTFLDTAPVNYDRSRATMLLKTLKKRLH